ncbi:MAG TPA: hypothetical protein VHO69_06835 [Phototrophicaceae bacterium]|nr:hypothetical protein [Phototrophicaceae bacterium]
MAYRYDVILEKYERVTLEEMREAHPLALGPFWGRPSRHGLPPVHFLPEVCAPAAQLGLAFVPLPTYSS